MFFYLFIFIISTYFIQTGSKCKGSQQPIMVSMGVILLAIVATFRSNDVGTDTSTYIELYDSIIYDESINPVLMMSQTDPFFILSCFISEHLGEYQFIFFLYSVLTYSFLYAALNKYKRYLPVWLGFIFFLFLFYNASLNIMRQILALTFVLWSTTFLFEGKKKKFFILALLSICFHLTAILGCIIIYIAYKFINSHSKNKSFIYLMFCIGAIMMFLCVNYIMDILVSIGYGHSYAYTSAEGRSKVGATDILMSFILVFISFYAMKRKLTTVTSPDFFFLVSVACLTLFMTGFYHPDLMRMAYYMLAFSCLYLPMITHSKKFIRNRNIYQLGVLFLGFAYWLYLFVISGSNATIPYSTIDGLKFDF